MKSLRPYQQVLPLNKPLSAEESKVTAIPESKSTKTDTGGMPRDSSQGNSLPVSDFFSSALVSQVEAKHL